jgi:hypothetical protein
MEESSAPGLKFENVGDVRSIVVRKVDKKVDTEPDGTPRTWPSGDIKNVFVFTGESDGEPASLWVRGNLVTAIRDAVKKAGLATVVNSKVTVKFNELGTPPAKGLNAPKLFIAKVEQVAPMAAAATDEPF